MLARRMGLVFLCVVFLASGAAQGEAVRSVVSLDGEWRLAVDPGNVGMEEEWWATPRAEAKTAPVPWIIQEAFPAYHGVAWYWREFTPLANQPKGTRCLLRFWRVDYKADVWLNGKHIGTHEGAESTFEFDVTEAVAPGANHLAVRVLNPSDTPIDGLVLGQIPHRNKVCVYGAGASFNHGGITDSVELVYVPAVYIDDLFVRADPATGAIRASVRMANAGNAPVDARVELRVASAREGATLERATITCSVSVKGSEVEGALTVAEPHLWDLNDPYLYRVTARLVCGTGEDECSVRTAFRDFRFEKGFFRLNGRRLFLRGSHTGNHCPIGQQLPHDPDILRRDLINVKAMGFNMIRFIAGVGERYQLDLCDEIGLLVYEEPYAGWCLGDSPEMAARFDESVLGMVYRDRNHPSIIMWGLLNETFDGPVFQHAKEFLPTLRAADDSRLVLLNSGRWDLQRANSLGGLSLWRFKGQDDPNVAFNGSDETISGFGTTWQPGQVSLHPGPNGEYSVLRWTAPVAGEGHIAATFASIAQKATTDVHIMHNGTSCFDGLINVDGKPNGAGFDGRVPLAKGDTLDFVVGFGSGGYGGDSTGLAVSIQLGEVSFNAAKDFSVESNPNGPWQYGVFQPGAAPDAASFKPYDEGFTHQRTEQAESYSNPGSMAWEPGLHDQHCYPHAPHTDKIIRSLREYAGPTHPTGMGDAGFPSPADDPTAIFLSEYGLGSAVDLVRVVKLFEQHGAGSAEDCQFYRTQRDAFLKDWTDWGMAETFGRPEDYFAQCIAKMAGQRTIGLNAIRANPRFVAYGLTGTVDQGMTGEGLTTTWRELKPGTFSALFDGLAPLRWCLFAEPSNLHRGGTIRLEAVLANEDALKPGTYKAEFHVFGPDESVVFRKVIPVTIPEYVQGDEPPLAVPVLDENVIADWPAGTYRLVARFLKGAAAAGRPVYFHVADQSAWPAAEQKVMPWGEDAALQEWLAARKIATVPFDAQQAGDAVILAGQAAPVEANGESFLQLVQAAAAGATVVFLNHGIFAHGEDPLHWAPLAAKGRLQTVYPWLYLKDDWLRKHPFFEGLPSGGLMDHAVYRGVITDLVWSDLGPSVCVLGGANKTSQGYASGVTMAVSRIGKGTMVVNTLRIRENLGTNPAADRILLNIIRHGRTLPETSDGPVQDGDTLRAILGKRWQTP